MKEFFKSTAGIIITIIVLIVAAILIGRSQWFKKLFSSSKPADGTPCTVTTASGNVAGTYKNGICATTGTPPPGGSSSTLRGLAPATLTVYNRNMCSPTISYRGARYLLNFKLQSNCYYKRV